MSWIWAALKHVENSACVKLLRHDGTLESEHSQGMYVQRERWEG